MAHLRCDFYSEALGLSTSMTVILPQQTSNQIGVTGAATSGPAPVLYLLHGLSDDDTIWLRHTSIERYVGPLGLAVVMPQVHRSFYTDEVYGGRYWTFLSEELPDIVGSFFRVSDRREDTFVAGLSMGGYGAMKWALRQPERFAAAASLSGAMDVAARGRGLEPPVDTRMFDRIFGGINRAGTEDDLLALLRTADTAGLPRLSVHCGTEDFLLDENRAFVAACAAAGVPLDSAFPPGAHEWGFWDTHIQEVLAWMWRGRVTT